jgi:hypothetical protein
VKDPEIYSILIKQSVSEKRSTSAIENLYDEAIKLFPTEKAKFKY